MDQGLERKYQMEVLRGKVLMNREEGIPGKWELSGASAPGAGLRWNVRCLVWLERLVEMSGEPFFHFHS